MSLQFKFSVHFCILCYLIAFPSYPFAYFLTSGYLHQTPDNSNFFRFPLKVRVIGSRLYLFFTVPFTIFLRPFSLNFLGKSQTLKRKNYKIGAPPSHFHGLHSDDDRIVSHDAPRSMLCYHYVTYHDQ